MWKNYWMKKSAVVASHGVPSAVSTAESSSWFDVVRARSLLQSGYFPTGQGTHSDMSFAK
jgi:hypothetical protein